VDLPNLRHLSMLLVMAKRALEFEKLVGSKFDAWICTGLAYSKGEELAAGIAVEPDVGFAEAPLDRGLGSRPRQVNLRHQFLRAAPTMIVMGAPYR
jgi:hypothetical protein